ncbi:MAG: hypothetical protein ABW352_15895 [Polyangiales bacterium]
MIERRRRLEEARSTLACSNLPEPSWVELCRRFRLHEVSEPGHGMVRNDVYLCDRESIDAVYCEQPPPLEEVESLATYVEARSRTLESVDTQLEQCVTALRDRMVYMPLPADQRPPWFAAQACPAR